MRYWTMSEKVVNVEEAIEEIKRIVREELMDTPAIEEILGLGNITTNVGNYLDRFKRASAYGDPPEAPETTEVEPEEVPDKSQPLSVSARQKNIPGGREQPISMQLQQLGLNQQTAQKIATRIGKYLKQRNIPVSENVFDINTARRAEGKQDRKNIRKQAANLTGRGQIIGKIITRFVSDNRSLLQTDPALKSVFSDRVKLNKLVKSVSRNLARQMSRRGYQDAEIVKLLEISLFTEITRLLNE